MRPLVVAVAAAVVLAPTHAYADANEVAARNTARKLGAEALKLYESGAYAEALEKFQLANQLVPAPTLGVRIARCLDRLGRLVEASETYLDVSRQELERGAPFVQKKAQVEAADEREKLLPRIPSLTVVLEGPQEEGVRVLVDGDEMPFAMVGQKRPIDPGKHTIEAIRSDTTVTRELTLKEGQVETVTIELPPLPVAPPPVNPDDELFRTIGWVGVGVGASGLVIGAANGVLTLTQQSSLEETCGADRACPESASGDVDFFNFTRVATTVGLAVGVAGLAVGIPLLLTTEEQSTSSTAVVPWVGPQSAGLAGTF